MNMIIILFKITINKKLRDLLTKILNGEFLENMITIWIQSMKDGVTIKMIKDMEELFIMMEPIIKEI